MFGIGGTELVIIIIFGFLLFGPDKLPQMGRTIGRAIRQFRNAQEQMNKVVRAEVYDPLADSEPLKDLTSLFSGSSQTSSTSSATHAASAQSGSEVEKKPKINPVKPLAPKGETFAQKKARLAREKAERDLERASAQVEAAKTAQTQSQHPTSGDGEPAVSAAQSGPSVSAVDNMKGGQDA